MKQAFRVTLTVEIDADPIKAAAFAEQIGTVLEQGMPDLNLAVPSCTAEAALPDPAVQALTAYADAGRHYAQRLAEVKEDTDAYHAMCAAQEALWCAWCDAARSKTPR